MRVHLAFAVPVHFEPEIHILLVDEMMAMEDKGFQKELEKMVVVIRTVLFMSHKMMDAIEELHLKERCALKR